MNLTDHFRSMAANNLWSNDRLYRAILTLQPGEFEATRISFFPSLSATLKHILGADLYYLGFLEDGGVDPSRIFPPEPDDPVTLQAAQLAADRRLVAFCGRLSFGDLSLRIDVDRDDAGIIPERIGDLLAHLFLHQIHHRGQVHAMLSGTSVRPPQLDEFLLDYDIKLRKKEVERLGL